MATHSERLITEINTNVFFKEFTFDKNDFYPKDGKKELADNFIFMDDLVFIFQIKERNIKDVKSAIEENKWFEGSVLKDAKNQIKRSIEYLRTYNEISVKNVRNHTVNVKKSNLDEANKVIIYLPNSSLIKESNRLLKFYESRQVGTIHIFHIEDYYWICRFLITPSELDEYLKFRERIYLRHKQIISIYPEQYILSHFLNTPDESIIREEYIDTLAKFDSEASDFNISEFLNNFFETIHIEEQRQSQDYYKIIQEIAKLNRLELTQFKERLLKTIENVKNNVFSMPYRFTAARTGCGFVFIPLMPEKVDHWKNALLNFTQLYKYKRKLDKCVGITIYKFKQYYDLQWNFIASAWSYDGVMDGEMKKDSEIFGKGKIIQESRYKFKSK